MRVPRVGWWLERFFKFLAELSKGEPGVEIPRRRVSVATEPGHWMESDGSEAWHSPGMPEDVYNRLWKECERKHGRNGGT